MNKPVKVAVHRPPRKAITARLQRKLDWATAHLQSVQREILERSPAAAPLVLPPETSAPKLVSELVKEYMAAHAYLAERSRRNRISILNAFAKRVGLRVNRPEVEAWYHDLTVASCSDGWKSQHCVIVFNFLRWCHETHRLPENYTVGLKCLEQPEQQPREPYTPEEYRQLVALATERQDHALAWLITLGYHTGMAIGDCCNLVWREVDLEHATIQRRRQKSKTPMACAFEFGGELYQALVRQRERTIEVFGSIRPGFPVCKEFYQKTHQAGNYFKHLVELAKIPYRPFHSWRGTFITDLVEGEVNLPTAMKLTGIRTAETFAKYAKIKEDTLRKSIKKIR